MATTSVSLQNTISIIKNDGTPYQGSLQEETVLNLVYRKVPLFAQGFISFFNKSETEAKPAGTFTTTIPAVAVPHPYSAAKAATKYKAEVVTLRLDNAPSFKKTNDRRDQFLFRNATTLKGVVLASQMIQAMKYEAARYYKGVMEHFKTQKAAGVDVLTIMKDSAVPSTNRTALMSEKLETLFEPVRFVMDTFTPNGVPNEQMVCFLKPSLFRRLKYGVAGQTHVITEIKTENEITRYAINGIPVFEDPLLGKNHLSGSIYEGEAFDLSKLSGIVLTRQATFHKAGNFFISELNMPGTQDFIQLNTWLSGIAFANAYTSRMAALVSEDL